MIAVGIECRVEKSRPVLSIFNIRMELGAGLTRREKTILFNAARSCEVGKMLAGTMSYAYKLTS